MMKSIIQEASTIAKAIENALVKANEPQEFTVRILEKPYHNFLGITTQSAKIALLFDEHAQKSDTAKPEKARRHHTERPEKKRQSAAKDQSKKAPADKKDESPHEKSTEKMNRTVSGKPYSLWRDEHTAYASSWLKDILKMMGYRDITFTVRPQHLHMKAYLSKPLLEDQKKERYMLSSLATLMMASMERNFGQSFPNHKVVLTHGQPDNT